MKAKRDDGTEIEVEYEVLEDGADGSFGAPGPCDESPSGPICGLTSAETAEGVDVLAALSDAERERIEIECSEQHEYDDGPELDYGDY